jgi:hypothetical protein
MVSGSLENLGNGCFGGGGDGVSQWGHDLAHGQSLQIEHTIDHGSFLRRESLG